MRVFPKGRLPRLSVVLLCSLLGACAMDPPVTPHSASEQAGIDQVQAALDGMRGLKARFLQAGPDNGIAGGLAWFETGHLRLEYLRPAARVVVATQGQLTMRDAATSSITRIALSANPLGLLLSGPVHLSGEIDVTDIQRSPTALQLSLARSANPAQGLLTLFFVVQPDGSLLLSGLEAVDAERHRTRFHLYDQQIGQNLDPALFVPPS